MDSRLVNPVIVNERRKSLVRCVVEIWGDFFIFYFFFNLFIFFFFLDFFIITMIRGLVLLAFVD